MILEKREASGARPSGLSGAPYAQIALASRGPAWLLPRRDDVRQDFDDDEATPGRSSRWTFARDLAAHGRSLQAVTPSIRIRPGPGLEEERGGIAAAQSERPSQADDAAIDLASASVPPDWLNATVDSEHEDRFGNERLLVQLPLGDSAGHDDSQPLLLLTVGGEDNDQLRATFIAPTRARRTRHHAAFDDYDGYIDVDALPDEPTRETLRDRAARVDEDRGTQSNSSRYTWEAKWHHLHAFPTRICSLHVASCQSEGVGRNSEAWFCVRTIASTVFAKVAIPRRASNDLDASLLSLRGILEVLHGNSILRAGVKGLADLDQQEQNRTKEVRSPHTITDVAFHPHEAHRALTIDARGTVGVFEVDLDSIQSRHWSGSTSWCPVEHSALYNSDTSWAVHWPSKSDEACVTVCMDCAWRLNLKDASRDEIYNPNDADLLSSSLSQSDALLLWIVTTKQVSCFDIGDGCDHGALVSYPHERGQAKRLRLSALEHAGTHMALLSSTEDRLTTVYSVVTGGGSTGEVGCTQVHALESSLPLDSKAVTLPLLCRLPPAASRWQRWISKYGISKDSTNVLLDVDKDDESNIWLRALRLCPMSSYEDRLRFDISTHHFDEELASASKSIMLAPRTRHSLRTIYEALFSRRPPTLLEEDSSELHQQEIVNEALRTIAEYSSRDTALTVREVLLQHNRGTDAILHHRGLEAVQDLLSTLSESTNIANLSKAVSLCALTVPILDADADALTAVVEQVTQSFSQRHDKGISAAAKERAVAIDANLEAATKELVLDLVTSSRTMSLAASNDMDEVNSDLPDEGDGEEEELDFKSPKHAKVKPFRASFFRSHLRQHDPDQTVTAEDGTAATLLSRSKLSRGAHALLADWELGSDPYEYQYNTSMPESQQGHTLPGSQSQSPWYSSRERSVMPSPSPAPSQASFAREASQSLYGVEMDGYAASSSRPTPHLNYFSQPLPSTASTFAMSQLNESQASPGPSQVPAVVQSQPVGTIAPASQLPSSQRARKKRRKGGF